MTSASAADTFHTMPMNLYLLTSANEGSNTRAIVQPIPPTDGGVIMISAWTTNFERGGAQWTYGAG